MTPLITGGEGADMAGRRITVTLVGVAAVVLTASACGSDVAGTAEGLTARATSAAATGPASIASPHSSGPPATTSSPTGATPTSATTTAAVMHVTNLDDRSFDGLQRVLTVSRSCSTPGAIQVRFKAGGLRRQQVRLLMIDRSGRLLRSSARGLSMTDAGPGGDGSGPVYGLRATWTLRQVSGPTIGTSESSDWRVVLVTASSTTALARPSAAVVPSCGDRVWHAPTPALEVTDVRRDCTAQPPTDGYFTAHVRAGGLVFGQQYSIDGGASGNDLNAVPRSMAETYDGDMVFAPGIDRRPSPNGDAAPFPRAAFTVTLRLGPNPIVDEAIALQPPRWFEARDETSEPVTVAVPSC